MSRFPSYGALVISLDFELHWGVRDKKAADGPYRENLLGVRRAVPALLGAFEASEVAATWATVGFLFARNRDDLEAHSPERKPGYTNKKFDPYLEQIGEDEASDPLHYASELIAQIRRTPRQEIGSHTFSHYYCLEHGQDERSFAADIDSCKKIASTHGVELRSLVFPRNQRNRTYDGVLVEREFTACRGNPRAWMYRAARNDQNSRLKRLGRLVDTYAEISGSHTTSWRQIATTGPLYDIPASFFVRPWSRWTARLEPLRLRRIRRSMEHAARAGEVVHLWWHPHNFGTNLDENLRSLRQLLDSFVELRHRYNMRSLTMAEAAQAVPGAVAN